MLARVEASGTPMPLPGFPVPVSFQAHRILRVVAEECSELANAVDDASSYRRPLEFPGK